MRKSCIFIVLLWTGLLTDPTQAQQYGPNLCRMLEHAHLNPTEFHKVVQEHQGTFTAGMMQYIQNRAQLLIQRADEHQQSCNQYPQFSLPYHQCQANNLPRQYAVYLGSLWQFLNGGITWPQTDYGRLAMEGLQACELLSTCAQTRELALQAIRLQCPNYLN